MDLNRLDKSISTIEFAQRHNRQLEVKKDGSIGLLSFGGRVAQLFTSSSNVRSKNAELNEKVSLKLRDLLNADVQSTDHSVRLKSRAIHLIGDAAVAGKVPEAAKLKAILSGISFNQASRVMAIKNDFHLASLKPSDNLARQMCEPYRLSQGTSIDDILQSFLDARDKLLSMSEPTADALTDQQHFALFAYSLNDGYSKMNGALRNPNSAAAADPLVQTLISEAKAGLNALRQAGLESSGPLHRGMTDYAAAPMASEGAVLSDAAFQSASEKDSVAKGFAHHGFPDNTTYRAVQHIMGEKGAQIAGISKYQGEREVVMDPGSGFRVVFNAEQQFGVKGGKANILYQAVLEPMDASPNAGRAGYVESLGLDTEPSTKRSGLQRSQSFSGTSSARQAGSTSVVPFRERLGLVALNDWSYKGVKPGGSNPGAVYSNNGESWLVKGNLKLQENAVTARESSDRAKNEVLAAKLLLAAGSGAPEMKLVDLQGRFGGGAGVASKMIDDVQKFNPSNPQHRAAICADYAVHAWLGNYDVLGMGYDNTVIKDNVAINIDTGGAILFRAQGLPKAKDALRPDAPEWESMQNTTNEQKAVFGNPDSAALVKESARKLQAITPDTIRTLVESAGPGKAGERQDLANLLIARREAILAKAGIEITS